MTEVQAKEIEPRVKTREWALYSPTTATVDPSEVVNAMVKDAQHEEVEIHYDSDSRLLAGTI